MEPIIPSSFKPTSFPSKGKNITIAPFTPPATGAPKGIEADLKKIQATPLKPSKEFDVSAREISQENLDKYPNEKVFESVEYDKGYEDAMRNTQGEGERALNSAKVFGANAVSMFGTGFAKIPNLIGSALNTTVGKNDFGDNFNLGYDSGINKTLYDWRDEIEKGNRNYKSDWAENHWIQNLIPIVGDGGFQEAIKSAGYGLGVAAEFYATGGLSKALSLGTGAMRVATTGAKVGGNIAKSIYRADKIAEATKGLANAANAAHATSGALAVESTILKFAEAIPDAYRLYVGAHGEASFEALEGQQRMKQSLISLYEQKHGRKPIGEDLATIEKTAKSAGESRYWMNMGLLAVPNYLQVGKVMQNFPMGRAAKNLFEDVAPNSVFYNTAKKEFDVRNVGGFKFNTTSPYWEKGIGKGLKVGVEKSISLFNRFPKSALSVSEGFEELGQTFIDELTSSAYKNAYLNNKPVDVFSTDAFKEAVGKTLSKEGAEAFLMGIISGATQQGGTKLFELLRSDLKGTTAKELAQSQELAEGFNRLFKGGEQAQKAFEEYLASVNTNSIGGKVTDKIKANVAASTLGEASTEAALRNDQFNFQTLKAQNQFELINEFVKTGKQDILIEYLADLKTQDKAKLGEFFGVDTELVDIERFAEDTINRTKELAKLQKDLSIRYINPYNQKDEINYAQYEFYKTDMAHKLWMLNRYKERQADIDMALSTNKDFYQKAATSVKDFKSLLNDKIKALSQDINALNGVSLPAEARALNSELVEEKTKQLEKLEDVLGRITTNSEDEYTEIVEEAFEAYTKTQGDNIPDNLQKAFDAVLLDRKIQLTLEQFKALDKKSGFEKFTQEYNDFFANLEKQIERQEKIDSVAPILENTNLPTEKVEQILDETPKDQLQDVLFQEELKETEIQTKKDAVSVKKDVFVKYDGKYWKVVGEGKLLQVEASGKKKRGTQIVITPNENTKLEAFFPMISNSFTIVNGKGYGMDDRPESPYPNKLFELPITKSGAYSSTPTGNTIDKVFPLDVYKTLEALQDAIDKGEQGAVDDIEAKKADIEKRRQEDMEKSSKESVFFNLIERLSKGSATLANLIDNLGSKLKSSIKTNTGEITGISFNQNESRFSFIHKGKNLVGYFVDDKWEIGKLNEKGNYNYINYDEIQDINKKYGSQKEFLKSINEELVNDIENFEKLKYTSEEINSNIIPLENSISNKADELRIKYGNTYLLQDFLKQYDAELAALQPTTISDKKADIEKRRQEELKSIDGIKKISKGKTSYAWRATDGVNVFSYDDAVSKEEVVEKINTKYDAELRVLEDKEEFPIIEPVTDVVTTIDKSILKGKSSVVIFSQANTGKSTAVETLTNTDVHVVDMDDIIAKTISYDLQTTVTKDDYIQALGNENFNKYKPSIKSLIQQQALNPNTIVLFSNESILALFDKNEIDGVWYKDVNPTIEKYDDKYQLDKDEYVADVLVDGYRYKINLKEESSQQEFKETLTNILYERRPIKAFGTGVKSVTDVYNLTKQMYDSLVKVNIHAPTLPDFKGLSFSEAKKKSRTWFEVLYKQHQINLINKLKIKHPNNWLQILGENVKINTNTSSSFSGTQYSVNGSVPRYELYLDDAFVKSVLGYTLPDGNLLMLHSYKGKDAVLINNKPFSAVEYTDLPISLQGGINSPEEFLAFKQDYLKTQEGFETLINDESVKFSDVFDLEHEFDYLITEKTKELEGVDVLGREDVPIGYTYNTYEINGKAYVVYIVNDSLENGSKILRSYLLDENLSPVNMSLQEQDTLLSQIESEIEVEKGKGKVLDFSGRMLVSKRNGRLFATDLKQKNFTDEKVLLDFLAEGMKTQETEIPFKGAYLSVGQNLQAELRLNAKKSKNAYAFSVKLTDRNGVLKRDNIYFTVPKQNVSTEQILQAFKKAVKESDDAYKGMTITAEFYEKLQGTKADDLKTLPFLVANVRPVEYVIDRWKVSPKGYVKPVEVKQEIPVAQAVNEDLNFGKLFKGITESMFPQVKKEIEQGIYWTQNLDRAEDILKKLEKDTYQIIEKSKTIYPANKPSFEVIGFTIVKQTPLFDDEGIINEQVYAAPIETTETKQETPTLTIEQKVFNLLNSGKPYRIPNSAELIYGFTDINKVFLNKKTGQYLNKEALEKLISKHETGTNEQKESILTSLRLALDVKGAVQKSVPPATRIEDKKELEKEVNRILNNCF